MTYFNILITKREKERERKRKIENEREREREEEREREREREKDIRTPKRHTKTNTEKQTKIFSDNFL